MMISCPSFVWRRTASVFAAALLGQAVHAGASGDRSPAEELLELDRPLVIAHRGYSELAPENTLPAFEFAKVAGADLIELDYHTTRDGVPLVIHDSTFDRTTDASRHWEGSDFTVADRSFEELKDLDAGQWFDPKFTGTRLPTLEESLEVIQADGGVTLIERKAGPAEAIAELLQEKSLVNEVVVQAFDWDYLSEVHEQLPEQVLGALGPPRTWKGKELSRDERALDTRWVDRARETGARVIGWNRQVSSDAIAYAQAHGLEVWVYTINDQPTAEWLLGLGVDGIITNNTSLIWKTLAVRDADQD